MCRLRRSARRLSTRTNFATSSIFRFLRSDGYDYPILPHHFGNPVGGSGQGFEAEELKEGKTNVMDSCFGVWRPLTIAR